LLGVLADRLPLDDGEVQRKPGLRVALVEQEPVLPDAPTGARLVLARGAIGEIVDERDRPMPPRHGWPSTCTVFP
jgi:ATPase subunit of ABC transporter with duplicated ATPase domains